MGTISTKSAFDSPMNIRFRSRAVITPKMAFAIKRAFVISAEARVANAHDFGMDLPVHFTHPDDAYLVSSQQTPQHVVVCTDRGGECMLALYPVGKHYECLVASGDGLRDLVTNHVGLYYTRYAMTDTGFVDEFGIDGLETLFADADGEFAGAVVDGGTLGLDEGVEDTTAQWRLGYAPILVDEHIPVGEVSMLDFDEGELLRLFRLELSKVPEGMRVKVEA